MRKIFLVFSFTLLVIAILLTSCINEENVKYTRYFTDGAQLYKTHCQNCHNANGEGLAMLIPPLTDTVYLRKNRNQLACIINYGLADTLKIHQKTYNFKMPANPNLAPIDLAKLLTFVTNSFGNQQGIYDVTEIENHLKNCR